MTDRALHSRHASLVSWAGTVDRERRTRAARNASPTGVQWHLNRLPAQFDNATESQRYDAADAARRAYMLGLTMKSAASRKRRSSWEASHTAEKAS